MSRLHRFNAWWDRQRDAVRFPLLMSAIALMAFPLELGVHFGNAKAAVFGLGMLVLVIILTIARVRWLRRPTPNLKDFTRSRL